MAKTRKPKTKLSPRMVKEILAQNPTISTIEELCAVKNCFTTDVPKDNLEEAKKLVERNRLRMTVILKQDLYCRNDQKSKELLYRMMCTDEEIQRFGVKSKESVTNINPVIEIKSADPNIIDKLNNI